MPTILPECIFYHIPKTGGTWVTEILKGIEGEKIKHRFEHKYNIQAEHASPLSYKPDRFSFAFVRHPIEWYKSMWKFRNNNEWHYESVFDEHKGNLDSWTSYMLEEHPGIYTEIVQEFENVDFMGRQENLRNDLEQALDMAGVKYDKSILERGKANVSGEKPELDSRLERQILKSEHWVVETYY